MKIVFFARELRRAGTTTHMLTLAEYLVKDGHEVTIFSYWDNNKVGDLIKEFALANIKLQFIPFPNDNDIEASGLVTRIIQIIKLLTSFIIGFPLLFKYKPDIIHVHFPITSYIANIYRTLKRVPIVITHHIGNMRPRLLYSKADQIIAVGSEIAETTKNYFNYPEEKVHVVYNGIDERKFNVNTTMEEKKILRKEQSIDENIPVLLYVGSIEHRKGIDVLLEACNLLKNDNEIGTFKLILLGSGSYEWLNELITKYDIEDNLIRVPFQEPLPFYRLSDMMILPSRVEGFGLVCVEAMMTGLATIRSDAEGAYDQIDNGVNGFIFKKENIFELYSLLKDMIIDKDKMTSISQNGKTTALEKFSSKSMYANTMQVYLKALNDYR